MPLINRIEMSNFMNSRREEPWRPDWAYQLLDLKGENTAINMPNGKGKSTIVHLVLATLAYDRSLTDMRLRHFAPQSTGHFTHVRMETYIWADDNAPQDMVAQAGGDFGGTPMVFGIYGNAGESGSFKLYAYRGTLEDCPIGRSEGNRITLIGNQAFLDKLSSMPGRFPAAQKDESRVNWRDFVTGIFDMASIEQQLVYQKAKGAEGSSGYFDVTPARNRTFAETVFYERLAPELLTDMMSNVEEFADERGIEDTIHQKVQGIIKAKVRTAKTADDLERTRHVLEEFDRVKNKAGTLVDAKAQADTAISAFSVHKVALEELVIDDPIPGLPRKPTGQEPDLVKFMVMQDGKWFLPDRVFEIFTGEKVSAINQRSERNSISSIGVNRSQVIDFNCDIDHRGSPKGGGSPGRLYLMDAALALVSATSIFLPPLNRKKAAEAVEEAFAWINEHGDTNPARLEQRGLTTEQAALKAELTEARRQSESLTKEAMSLQQEQQQISTQQAEFHRMSASGLFTEAELANPAETGRKAQDDFQKADSALNSHQRKKAEHKGTFGEWKDFIAQHGDDADPAAQTELLMQAKADAEEALSRNESGLSEARRAEHAARQSLSTHEKRHASLTEKIDAVANLRPLVRAFKERFGDVSPVGVEQQVRRALSDADNRLFAINTQRVAMKGALDALCGFRGRFGSEASPMDWLAERDGQRGLLASEIGKRQDELDDLNLRRADLDKAAVAPGKVAREVLAHAGSDAIPLYAAIDALELPHDRKERLLSVFSALLFSPVYAEAARAAEVARKLASEGVESPVFVISELEEFCQRTQIEYDGATAKTWLVGVRTRPVDCILDPALVDKEKESLEEQIARTKEDIADKKIRHETLNPEGDDSVMARKAFEAIEKDYATKDAALKAECEQLELELPILRDKASDEAIRFIVASVEYERLLGGLSEAQLQESHAKVEHDVQEAQVLLEKCADNVESLSKERELLQESSKNASVKAASIPLLNRIKAFIDADLPAFMLTADSVESDLAGVKAQMERRKDFRFDIADGFVRRGGGTRPQEIERRLAEIVPERNHIQDKVIPELEGRLSSIGQRLVEVSGPIVQIDNLARELQKKYRDMAAIDVEPCAVPNQRLIEHPLYQAAISVRNASSTESVIATLLAMRDPVMGFESVEVKNEVSNAVSTMKKAREALLSEIDRIKNDSNLALNEQMRIGLEQSKEDVQELLRMIEVTADNYKKSLAANETSRKHLDEEWGNIGAWLENFTRRLPGNFEVMRSVFRPGRDNVSGEIVTAGFEIEARISDMKDVRSILTGIVEKVEKAEKNREIFADDEANRTRIEKNIRNEIRDEFYRSVIIDPKIRVCIPAISRRPLTLEKNMVSSGQGVAMTLLWIVKMADYVTEREIRKRSVSNAGRNRVRSMRTQFVIIDGAFSHLSDKRLITDALDGVRKTRGKFQLVITGHDPNYKNDYNYFPTYIAAREIGGNMMYADSETRRLLQPEEVGSRIGAMESAAWHKLPEHAE